MEYLQGLMGMIDASPTAFHAVAGIVRMLEAAGFERLEECEIWRLTPGGRYYLTRNQSSVIAFCLPEGGALTHFQIVASHSDSPAFKLKPASGFEAQGYAMLNVEKYGGMLMNTWMDRPLSVAGRLIVRTPRGMETRLVDLGRDAALIPNMPIHFNRGANDGVAINPQVDMLPIVGEAGADLMAEAARCAGVEKDAVAGADLFLYNRDRARLWGLNGEFIAAPRLDDLECAYASARAIVETGASDHVNMMCVFDNEEVGSGTKQGADSTLLTDVLRRIALALGAAPQAAEAAIAASFMLSADNAHAVHPNHADKYDAQNRVRMNGGVVVKFNANQKYTSDGVSAAVFEGICADAGVPVQRFANRSDVAGGSTLGNIANAHASMNTVDIGLAQLAMHSALETAGARDIAAMIAAMRAFHAASIRVRRDGLIELG